MADHRHRDTPTVEAHAIEIGELLGKGGFAVVHSVQADIFLNPPHKHCGNLTNKKLSSDESDNNSMSSLQSSTTSSSSMLSTETPSRQLALKQLNHKALTTDAKRQRAERDLRTEARLLASIPVHPHIVRLHGVSVGFWDPEDDDADNRRTAESCETSRHQQQPSPFILLERLEYTLEQQLKEWKREVAESTGRPSCSVVPKEPGFFRRRKQNRIHKTSQLARLRESGVVEVANAMAFLHRQDILFRDLKPGNVGFLNGRVKLFDFGLARKLPRYADPGEYELTPCVGTPNYMAPEVIGYTDYSFPADVYSFGMMLWEICALEIPFARAPNVVERLHAVVDRKKEYIPSIQRVTASRRIQRVVGKCWEYEDSQRPCFAWIEAELAYELSNNLR